MTEVVQRIKENETIQHHYYSSHYYLPTGVRNAAVFNEF